MATIQGVYIALFGRPADPAGLAFFNQATLNGQNLSVIGDLAGQPEYLDRFNSLSTSQIITEIYQSLFNRDPDPAGLAYFTQQLNSGAQSINSIAINILDGAQNNDLAIINNKLSAANSFTSALDTPAEVDSYTSSDDADIGRQFLGDINQDVSTIPTGPELVRYLNGLSTNQSVPIYSYDDLYATDPSTGNFYFTGEPANDMLRAVSFLGDVNIELGLDVRTTIGGQPNPVDYVDGEEITVFEVSAGTSVEIAYSAAMDDLVVNQAPDLTRGYVFKLLVDQDKGEGIDWVEYTLEKQTGIGSLPPSVSPYIWNGDDGSTLSGDGGLSGVSQSVRDFFAGNIANGDKHDVRLELYEREPGGMLGSLVSELHIQVVGLA